MKYKIKKNRDVSPEEFIKVRETTDFVEYHLDDMKYGLENSLLVIGVYDEENIIGVARIVGDGRVAFIIKDVIVIPEYQKLGIGKILIEEIFKYLDENAVNNAYVGLMSTKDKESFYEKFGFIRRPNEKYGSGMIMYYEKK